MAPISWRPELLFLLALAGFLGCLHHALRSDRPLFIAPSNPGYGNLVEVSLEELTTAMGAPKTVLLDARPPESFRKGTIPGSLSLPLHSTLDETALAPLRQADRVIVFCSSKHCNASRELAVELLARGLTQVRVYPGGTAEWKTQGKLVLPRP